MMTVEQAKEILSGKSCCYARKFTADDERKAVFFDESVSRREKSPD